MTIKTKRIIVAVALLLVAVLSFTVIYNAFSDSKFIQPRVNYLDGKKTTVMEMSAVAVAASAAITLIPGDVGTPLADKLADLTTYSLIILSAVFIEKYLLGLVVLLAFRILIPVGLIVAAGCVLLGNLRFFRFGAKLALCGALIFAVIPASILVSQTIEATYQSTLEQTIDTAREDSEEIQENSESQSALEKFINSIKGGAQNITKKFERTLTNMIEGFAVLIVTSCVIPILVYVLMWWILKTLFKTEFGPSEQGEPFYAALFKKVKPAAQLPSAEK